MQKTISAEEGNYTVFETNLIVIIYIFTCVNEVFYFSAVCL